MNRLTDEIKFHLTTFNRCQLCGFESQDICKFKLWQECDEEDKPEPGKLMIVCDNDIDDKADGTERPCAQRIEDHPRLYLQVPWGMGRPGYFILLCGPCKYRDGLRCKHSDLKENGGQGLDVSIGGLAAIYCTAGDHDFDLKCHHAPRPAVDCKGFERIEGHVGTSHCGR